MFNSQCTANFQFSFPVTLCLPSQSLGVSWASVLKWGTQFSSLQEPKQKPNSQFWAGKFKFCCMLRIIHKHFFHRATFTYIFFNEMRKEVHSISTTRPTHTYLLLSPKLDFVGKILLIKGGMYYYLVVKLIQSLIDATILLIQCWIVSRYSKSVFKWSSSLDRSPPWYLYLLCSKKRILYFLSLRFAWFYL